MILRNLEDKKAESSDFTIDSQCEFTQNTDNQESDNNSQKDDNIQNIEQQQK